MTYSYEKQLPPMESLVAALTAAKLGSFSAAALELGITHAAVSRRVAAAEEWAGMRLFERHGRGVKETPNGQRILVRAQAALEVLIQLGGMPYQRRQAPAVRLAVTPSFARFWLLPHILELEGAPASVRIEIVADLLYADVDAGEVDVAIRYGKGNWGIGHERRLFDDSLVPATSTSIRHRLQAVTAADVVRLPLLHNGDTMNWRKWCDHHSLDFRPKPEDRTFVEYGLTLDAAAAGLGVALWNQRLHTLGAGITCEPDLAAPGPSAYHLISRTIETRSPVGLLVAKLAAAAERCPS